MNSLTLALLGGFLALHFALRVLSRPRPFAPPAAADQRSDT